MTKEQRKTVESILTKKKSNTTIQLIASAGSGKTYTIIEIVKRYLEEYPQKHIALITFTQKSAKEMRDRLQEYATKVSFVGTMHALAYSKIKTTIADNINIISDTKKLYQQLLKVHFPDLSQNSKYIEIDTLHISILQNLQNDYLRYKKENSLYDFDDLIILATKQFALENKSQYDLLLIDEFQDTSYQQLEFIQSLKAKKVLAVGDPKQSIYSFRKADPSIFSNISSYFPNTKSQFLSYNFRSQRKIVSFSNKFIKKNQNKLCKTMKATIPPSLKPFLYFSKRFVEITYQYHIFINKFNKLYNHQTLTILVRTNYIRQLLEKENKKIQCNHISILTIHQSKGLEFQHVAIFGVVPTIIPHKWGDISEEERLFYVAMTRARETLHFITWGKAKIKTEDNPFSTYGESKFLPFLLKNCHLQYLS